MKTVILGAGSSKGCGFPLGQDMLCEVCKELDKDTLSFVSFLFPGLNTGKLDAYLTFDRLYSVIDYYIKNNLTLDKYTVRAMQGYKNRLFHVYISILSRYSLATDPLCENGACTKVCELYENYSNWYRPFFKKLISENKDIAFVSFNYDVLVDKVLRDMLNEKLISDFSYGVELYDLEKQDDKIRQGGLYILKPHGSLNIAECPVCKKLYSSQTNYSEYFFKDVQCEKCACHLVPVYKPPKVNKENDDFALNEVRDVVVDVLSKSDEVIIIGYALPNYDMNVLAMLAQGRLSNPSWKNTKLTIIDTDEKLKDKYYSVFGVEALDENCHWHGFSEYAKKFLSSYILKNE